MNSAQSAGDRAWYIAQRWQQYHGEARANLLRIAAIAVFYSLHLWNYLASQGRLPAWSVLKLSEPGAIDRRFHLLATLLALAWAAVAAMVLLCLRNRVFPRWMSAATTCVDVVMLTCVLGIANGPRSPLTVGYFLIIVLAALRFSLPVVRLATAASVAGYVCTLGVAKWPERFGREAAVDLSVPRFEQLVMLAAIALCGVFAGQVVRQSRQVAGEYARLRSAEEGGGV
ncbi:MAG: hypothetical protein JNL18_00385 [Planctomycetaceae bacterium]|nr:hypothetical protein [Planctomycetaceae bacterium]